MKKTTYLFAFLMAATGLLSSCSSDESVQPQSGAMTNSADGRGAPGQTGQGGSMARFTISGNNLYTVDDASLTHYDITNLDDPQRGNRIPLGFGVETIFPYEDKLFIGTQNGMFIMGLQNPSAPNIIAQYQHIVSCDPVVADSRYAYITLSTGTACRRAIDELQIVDLKNIANPQLIRAYPMVNPKGLGIDSTNLFVCDDGLKLYDATDVRALNLKQHFKINAFDVIPNKGNLLVIGSDGFYQYSYKNNKLELLSKIGLQQPM